MTDIIFTNVHLAHEASHDKYIITNPSTGCETMILIPTSADAHWGPHLETFDVLENTTHVQHGLTCECNLKLLPHPLTKFIKLVGLIHGTGGFQKVFLPIPESNLEVLRATAGEGDPAKSYRTCSLVLTQIVAFRDAMGMKMPDEVSKAEVEAVGEGEAMRFLFKGRH